MPRLKKTLKYLLLSILVFIGLSVTLVLVFRFLNPPISAFMITRNIQNDRGWFHVPEKNWMPIENIALAMPVAVVASEDNLFFEHHGFDWKAIREAREKNKTSKRLKGGSSISQQTAKNLFLSPHRTYLRKGLEVWFTFLIEFYWDKARILEVYLNILETGPDMYGVDMAAQKYFHKSAAKLSKSESAMIAACLPSPLKRKPNQPTEYLSTRQKWILWNMNNVWPVVESGLGAK
ncbi:MAG: monofunctional biosynthetic peptidoglycan transglycosylase [Bacteroidales bacterium]|nr:monofunctional biosynthetic peptidoglycan transglycosylase [Bacteroidales bacterium]MCF8454727.1 monofunctional biosynthetic peptidoglycan transglycosylase [Bacteroidales bacterium]